MGKETLKEYTVVGIYEGGRSLCEKVKAVDGYAAMKDVAKQAQVEGEQHNLQIIGAFAGRPDFIPVSDDNENPSYAVDVLDIG